MTLTTHIVIAAAITKPLMTVSPVFAFLAAIASHYLSDAIPHWDYSLTSLIEEKGHEKQHWQFSRSSFLRDLRNVAIDGLLGAGMIFLFFWPDSTAELVPLIFIITGAILPDFLEGLYSTRRLPFLELPHRLHAKIHTKIKLGPYPLIGIPFQVLIFLIALCSLL